MQFKTTLFVFITFASGFSTSLSNASDTISCGSFEGCADGSVDVTNQLLQMQAEIAELQGLVGLQTCKRRISESTRLSNWYVTIKASCLAGEKVITGGFENGTWNALKNCNVIANYPNSDQTEWIVVWGMPTQEECAAAYSTTYAVCCK